MKKMKDYTDKELDILCGHMIKVETIKQYCDPLSAWSELEKPITVEEILLCVKEGREHLEKTPLWTELLFNKNIKPMTDDEVRENHVKKIAYFLKNKANEAITMDVGFPDLNCYVFNMLEDGNHRLAAAIIRGDKEIFTKVGGSESYARELGLWNPNIYLAEIVDRYNNKNKRKEEIEQPTVAILKPANKFKL